jgi:hypothetical protein
VAQERIGSTGENRRQALAVEREVGVADSEDPSVETMQTPRAHRAMNGRFRKAERSRQLTDRDDPMLPLREIRKRAMSSRRVFRSFLPHSE